MNSVKETAEFRVDHASKPFARLLLAHGAGAPMDSSFMEEIARALAERGVEVVRFEFPYMAKRRRDGKRRPPDRADTLLACWDETIRCYSESVLPLFIGGKSMGGRIATLWAAEADPRDCRGVVCLGYPFHPPGKPQTLRIAHLSKCRAPLLIVQGERDSLGSRTEVDSYKLADIATFCWLTSANHDLKPLRSSGYTHQSHLHGAADATVAFMRKILNASAL